MTTDMIASDFISHHMPVKNRFETVLTSLDEKAAKKPLPGPKVRASRGMTRDRIIAAGFIIAGHLFGLYGIYLIACMPFWTALKWTTAVLLGYLIPGTMGITAGAHRLWAHRTYKANLPARLILAFMNLIDNQSSILHWALEHRVHHQYVDSEADPHNINEGFWHAHMLWLFRPRSDAFVAARKKIDASDLLNDPVVYYQDKYYGILAPFCCYILPTIAGYYFTGEAFTSFVLLGQLRWVILLHATWCVNSVAHMFGERPYRPNEKPTEIGAVSLISGGEGWHNWHHAFPWDYSASETNVNIFWRFNLARFWIDCFAALGWVWDRKVQRVPTYVEYADGARPY